MDGVTDATFRRVIAAHGKPDVAMTEFTHVHDICRGPEMLLQTLVYSEAERPIVAQLYGNDPALFYLAVQAACELGFDGIDINMGCPSKSVASSGSGAGLIRTPEVALEILRESRRGIQAWADGQTLEQAGFKPARIAAIRAMNVARQGTSPVPRRMLPLSVKTRLGYDRVIVEHWIADLLEARPAAISLHGRTLQQMYRGEADWTAIAQAAQLVKGTGTILLGNGDVQSLQDVVSRVRMSQVDGVLVGRAVLGAPWFFQRKDLVREVLREDEAAGRIEELPVEFESRCAVMLDHARQFQGLCGPGQFHRMRKHLGWYCKGFPHAAAMRARMFAATCVDDVERILDDYRADQAQGRLSSAELPPSPLADVPTVLESRCS